MKRSRKVALWRERSAGRTGVAQDGTRISVEFTILPFHDSSGRTLGMAATLRDVTARFDEMKALRAAAAESAGEQHLRSKPPCPPPVDIRSALRMGSGPWRQKRNLTCSPVTFEQHLAMIDNFQPVL